MISFKLFVDNSKIEKTKENTELNKYIPCVPDNISSENSITFNFFFEFFLDQILVL